VLDLTSTVCAGIAPQWPALAAGGPIYASAGWLRAMAGRLGDGAVTIMVSANGEPVVAALASVQTRPASREVFDLHYIFVSPTPPLPLTEAARTRRARLAESSPPPSQWVPSLVVMLPGYECLPVGPGRDDKRMLAELADAACGYADQQGLRTVAFLYTRPEDVALAAVLADRQFTGVPLSLTWDLAVPPGGLPDYLEALPSKRRREAKRELSLLARSGVRIGELDHDALLSEPVLSQLAALRCQLAGKYQRSSDVAAERARLERLISFVGAGHARVITAMAGETMVGFSMFCPYGSTWYCVALGYDYTDPRSRLCYFGTAFYGAVPVAAADGARRLSYGQGAAQAKRARGCKGTPLTCWVSAHDPALTAAVLASAAVTALEYQEDGIAA
jgi:Peptidogalycan biosysnthesis/recognition